MYHFVCTIYDNENNMTFANMKRKLGRKYNQIMDGGQITVKYAYALWQWRQVKQQTENPGATKHN